MKVLHSETGNLASDHNLRSLAVACVHVAIWEPPADYGEMRLRLQKVGLILPSVHSHNLITPIKCFHDQGSTWNSSGVLPHFNRTT